MEADVPAEYRRSASGLAHQSAASDSGNLVMTRIGGVIACKSAARCITRANLFVVITKLDAEPAASMYFPNSSPPCFPEDEASRADVKMAGGQN
jgi:hypothetical protein